MNILEKKKPILIKNAIVYTENDVIENGAILIKDGKIADIKAINICEENIEVIELNKDDKVIPGFIDIHIHGTYGADVMDGTEDALLTIAKSLPSEGTTSFLATTITQEHTIIENSLMNITNVMNKSNNIGQAEILGVHLEGPFISTERAGAQASCHICKPSIDLFQKWESISNGAIKIVTLAPEIEGGVKLINYLKSKGIIASVGHSNATAEQMKEAIDAGATHVTHMYNGMRNFHHREPGVAGIALTNNELFIEIICDGVHSHQDAVKLAYIAKGKERLIIVTDAMRAKGLKDGIYDLGGQSVFVKDKKAVLKNGTLAGSMLKMDDGFKNMISFTHCRIEDAIVMTSLNPAKQLKVEDRKGSIAKNKDADIVILNNENHIIMTFCRGILAYKNETLSSKMKE